MRNKQPPPPNLFWPLTIIIVGMVVVIAMIGYPAAAPQVQSEHAVDVAVEGGEQRQIVMLQQDDAYNTAQAQTAAAGRSQTQTSIAGAAYPDEDDEPTDEPEENDGDDSDTGNDAPAPRADSPSPTPEEETSTPTITGTPTDTPSPTRERTVGPTATNTVTPTPDDSTLECIPGQVTFIEGEGPPSTELVLWFNENPVGGTISENDGTYRIPLVVGDERVETRYLIQVKTRYRRELVADLICVVPAPTPTLSP